MHVAAGSAPPQKKYDVAISFLSKDEPLALQLEARLSEGFTVFVYSKRQEELAGTDGLEAFRQTFRTDSRTVVVLYRAGWGDTRWTRVEEAAIKDRAFNEGWTFLLFVILDDDTPPPYLPDYGVRMNYAQFGFEQLLGAVKARATQLGSVPKMESALERAQRLERDQQLREERQRRLREEASGTARTEYEGLVKAIESKITELNGTLKTLRIEFGRNVEACILRTGAVSVSAYVRESQDDFFRSSIKLFVHEWNTKLILPHERDRFHPISPRPWSTKEFEFDYQHAYGWCWLNKKNSENEFLMTNEIADWIVGLLVEFHHKYEKGEVKRRTD
jgi:hypothetical protein